MRFEGSEFGQKRCKMECSDVSGTTWKNPLPNPWVNDHFSVFSPIFHLSLPNIWHSYPFLKYFFEMYENRAIITQNFI